MSDETTLQDKLTIGEQIANGRFVNLDIKESGNSSILVIPAQIMKSLSLCAGQRVMVVPYE